MDVFDEDFQEYISWLMGKACSIIENTEEWQKTNKECAESEDIFRQSINEEQQKELDKFLHCIWKKTSVEMGICYKLGITDRKGLKKYEKLHKNFLN